MAETSVIAVWALVAGALGLSAWALVDALSDYRELRAAGLNGRRRVIAAMSIRAEVVRVVVLSSIAAAALGQACAIAVGVAAVAVGTGLAWDRRDRRRLIDLELRRRREA